MSLILTSMDVFRNTKTRGPAAGEIDVPVQIYTGISGYINYRELTNQTERSESTIRNRETGPGVATLTRIVITFDPNPGSDIVLAINDEVHVADGRVLTVVGVRNTYEQIAEYDTELLV